MTTGNLPCSNVGMEATEITPEQAAADAYGVSVMQVLEAHQRYVEEMMAPEGGPMPPSLMECAERAAREQEV